MKKLTVLKDGSKKLNPLSQEEIDRKLDEINNPKPFEPSDLEVRLAALEIKAGITEDDKDAARTALKSST